RNMSAQWTNQRLDELRQVGDEAADATVGELFANQGIEAVNELMRTLVTNDGLPSEELPTVISTYLANTAHVPEMDSAKVRLGEEVFGVLGTEILLILGFYSLPADYAAKKGVQVLYRTGRLITTPIRRVFETTQMVVDVMSPGGLSPQGKGVRSAQKVRL